MPQLITLLDGQSFPAAPTPSVGIFWRVGDHVVVDYSVLDEAEEYGDCLTHATGHYDRWRQWQRLGGRVLLAAGYPKSILSTEYDEWPRGRIVYEKPANLFVIYADRHLQRPDIVAALKTMFDLNATDTVVKGDLHYRSSPIRQ